MIVYDDRLRLFRTVTYNDVNGFNEAYWLEEWEVKLLYDTCKRAGSQMWAYEPMTEGGKLLDRFTIGF